MTDRPTRVQGQSKAARAKREISADPKTDPFDGAEDWLFVVVNVADVAPLARCGEFGLTVGHSGQRDIKCGARGKNVIVVIPSDGPGHQQAIELAERLRPTCEKLVELPLDGLGSEETPDLEAYASVWNLPTTIALERPWEKKPAPKEHALKNGNGRHPAGMIGPSGAIDYGALSPEQLGIIDAWTIKEEPIDWLWKYRLARGEMALMAGEGGLGKSQVLLAIAAAISTGSEWPAGEGRAPVGRTVILSAEDSPKQTIVPRLRALGADLSKISIVTAKVKIIREGREPEVSVMSLQNLAYWRSVFDKLPDSILFIVDPIPSYLGRGVNDQRNSEIREVLEPFLDEIVRERKLCFFANTHLNKSIDAKNPLHRVAGSIAYGNLPRNVHFVVPDPDKKGQRFFMQCKCNNAPDDLPALPFRIEQQISKTESGADIETSMPIFESEGVSVELVKALAGEKGRRGPKPTASNEVAEWLFEVLKTGPTLVAKLADEARERKYMASKTASNPKPSMSPLYNAKNHLPIVFPDWTVRDTELVVSGRKRKAWELVSVHADSPIDDGPAF